MKTTAFAILSFLLVCGTTAYADTFGSGSNTFEIEFVTIGNPGNPGDNTSATPFFAGSVAETYRIGKFEISEDMINKANTLGGLGLTHDNIGDNKPATSISWFEAAKFVNWLNGSTPAYKFDDNGFFQLWDSDDAGYNPNNLYRNTLATYFLPSIGEWYKAAYYDASSGVYYNYPTGSDTLPITVASGTAAGTAVYNQLVGPADITQAGGLSPYGTMGQGGNVYEWEETDGDFVNDSTSYVTGSRGLRGGNWRSLQIDNLLSSSVRSGSHAITEFHLIGFRVASTPEPTTCTLALAALCLAMSRRRAF